MRGQQVVIQSQKDVQALLAALRQEVNQGSFFLVWSRKDFAGSVANDGSFDIRVIHRSQRGAGAFTPHLAGRIVPTGGGARIEGRLDYGGSDRWMRWLLLLPIPLFATVGIAKNSDPWIVLWISVVCVFGAFALPPLAYWFTQDDEGQLCALFERVAGGVAIPAAVEPR